jgi:hypothetical protein
MTSRAWCVGNGLVLALLLAGCGCDTVGYPAIDASVVDGSTGSPLPLADALISSQNELEPQPFVETRSSTDTTSRFTTCCFPGVWTIRINKPGYVPYDTTVTVRSRGRCDRPELLRLTVRLHRLAAFAPRRNSWSPSSGRRSLTAFAADGGVMERAEALASLVSTARSYGIRRS